MSKKELPILYSDLSYKMDNQELLGHKVTKLLMQYVQNVYVHIIYNVHMYKARVKKIQFTCSEWQTVSSINLYNYFYFFLSFVPNTKQKPPPLILSRLRAWHIVCLFYIFTKNIRFLGHTVTWMFDWKI